MPSDSVSPPDRLLTRDQAAAYLGVSPTTLTSWGLRGKYSLPLIKVGKSVRYRQSDLDAWLREQTVLRSGDERHKPLRPA